MIPLLNDHYPILIVIINCHTQNIPEPSEIISPMEFRSFPCGHVPSTADPMSVTIDDVTTHFVFPDQNETDNVFVFLNDEQCRNCLRNDSTMCPLQLKSCYGDFTQRKIRLLKVTRKHETFLLCNDCQIYLGD